MIALYTSKMCMICVCDFEGFTQKYEILRYCFYVRKWRTREDSNLWPLPSEGSALSSWATSAIGTSRFHASIYQKLLQMMSHLSIFRCLSVTNWWPVFIAVRTTGTTKVFVSRGWTGATRGTGAIASELARVLGFVLIHTNYLVW